MSATVASFLILRNTSRLTSNFCYKPNHLFTFTSLFFRCAGLLSPLLPLWPLIFCNSVGWLRILRLSPCGRPDRCGCWVCYSGDCVNSGCWRRVCRCGWVNLCRGMDSCRGIFVFCRGGFVSFPSRDGVVRVSFRGWVCQCVQWLC